jgi:outer membrane receptor protein involved in Fe transport
VAVLAAGLATGPAWGQASEPSRADKPVQQVEVVGGAPLPGAGISRRDIAAPVQRASEEDIRRSGALDLSDFLNREFASVHVNEMQGNALQMDLNFRGFTASPLLGTPQGISVYLDGVRLNQPFGDVVSWDLIPRNALAEVTLLPGSNPLFGLNTLGGALVLETKDGRSHPGGEVGLKLGSSGRQVLDLAYGRAIGDALDLFISGQAFKDDGWRDASPSDQKQIFAKLGWRSAGGTLKLTLAHADTDLTGNGLQDGRFLAQRWASVYTVPDDTRNRSTLLSLVGTREVSRELSLAGNVYARHLRSSTLNGDVNDGALDQNLYFNPTAANRATLDAAGLTGYPTVRENAANTAFPYWNCALNAVLNDEPNEKCTGILNRSTTQQSAWGLALQAAFKGRFGGMAHQFTVGGGLDASQVDFRQSSEFGALRPDHGVTGTGVFADGTQTSENAFDARVDLHARSRISSLYAQDVLTLGPGSRLTLAGRWNRSVVTMQDRLDPTGTVGTLNGHHRFSRLNPALSLVTALNPAIGAYAGLSEGSRAPTATELGCADPADPCRLPNSMASDPPLKQVVTRTLEAGLRSTSGDWRWNLGVFRADNRNDILFVAAQTAGSGYFRNVARTRRQGLEAGLSTQTGAFDWGADLTLLDATFRSDETLLGTANSSNDAAQAGQPGLAEAGSITVKPGDRLPLIPRQMLKLHARWQALPALSLGLEVVGVSGSLARGNENGAHQPDGTLYIGEGRSAGYALANLSLGWQISKGLELTAQVDNLFDRRYTTAAVLAATPFSPAGAVTARTLGSVANPDGTTSYAVRHAAFYAPGAPRAGFVGVRYRFD